MPTPNGSRATVAQTLDRFRPNFDAIIGGAAESIIPCSPAEQSKTLGQCGIALRWAGNQYETTSEPTMKPYWALCGALKFEKVPEGIRITRKPAELLRPMQSATYSVGGGPARSETINPESIDSKVKKHEKAVIASFRSIMRTGLSMLNRVNAATTVVDMLEDPKTAPDFKDKLLSLRPDCFDVFQEVVDLDISDYTRDGKATKEAVMLEGAKLRAIKWLSEKTGESRVDLWPPKMDAEFKRRMERARTAACCTTTTPGRIFENPAVLICFYDDDLNAGMAKLHKWQIEELEKFARPLAPGEMHRQAVAAANGSGKSKNLGAPCAVWGAMEHASGVTVLTTASGKQLDRQSCKYLNAVARQVNRYHGGELWRIQYRKLTFLPIDSDVEMFATDEPGQAEGWHPKVDGGYFAILVDEAKTVSEEIFSALQRCNGCLRRLDYSSPGQPSGHFFKKCTEGPPWMFRKVTAFDCPHISQAEIQEVIKTYGENSPLTRSIIYAEFTSLDGNLVLTLDKINRCIRHAKEGVIPWKKEPHNRAGLDIALSRGGDESVFSVWNGNKMLAQRFFRESDLEVEADKIIALMKEFDVAPEHVTADAGGLGKPVIQRVERKLGGKHLHWFYAGSQPKTVAGKNFASRATECWHNFARLVEESEVILLEDPVLIDQLANRYYKQAAREGKIVLEEKREAKAAGHPSPDRADACVLANVSWEPEPEPVEEKPRTGKSIEAIMQAMEDAVFEDRRPQAVPGSFPTLQECC